MAHFAEITQSGIVLRVLVVPNEQEHRGNAFLASDLGLGGQWVQCSYNGTMRKQFPGAGYRYDATADVFITPQPYPSWLLDANYDWQPPIPKPCDGNDYAWNESEQTWELINEN